MCAPVVQTVFDHLDSERSSTGVCDVADVEIPQEAVEAAVDLSYRGQQLSVHHVRHVLKAAAPLIVAAGIDRMKVEIERLAAERDAIGDDDYEAHEDDGDCCGDAGECHRSGAMASYARTRLLLARCAAELRGES